MKTEIEKLRAIGDALREVELPRTTNSWLKETMGKAITLVDDITGFVHIKEWCPTIFSDIDRNRRLRDGGKEEEE